VSDATVLLRPLITEKAMSDAAAGRYTFEVVASATKYDVKSAVESAFKVDVLDVNVMTLRGKKRRVGRRIGMRPNSRKALVRLAEGQKIQQFFVEGV
jgi:large subunit ribosomal protein L23